MRSRRASESNKRNLMAMRNCLLVLGLLTGCQAATARLPEVSQAQSTDADSMCLPRQVHLALTENNNEMRVMWKTVGDRCKSEVRYWPARLSAAEKNASRLQSAASNGVSSTYSSDDMCGSPARDFDFAPLNLHTYVMTDLGSGSQYEYEVRGSHDTLSFQAGPDIGPDARFSFVVYADMGESDHPRAKAPGARATADAVTDEVQRNGVELVLHVGDISYANGDPEVWDTFMGYIEPYASQAPYMIAIGNHEYDYHTGKEKHKHHHHADPSGADHPYDPEWGNYGNDSGGECGVTTARRFIMPGAPIGNGNSNSLSNGDNRASIANPPFWYSFDYGSVHFVMLSTEHDITPGSDQYKWLEVHLAGVNRCSTPWLVVGMHRPMYVVHPHKSNRVVAEHLRESLESLYNRYNVDLVVSGHVHSYARTCNVYKEECTNVNKQGTTYVILGCGGHKLSDVDHEQYGWLDYAEINYGYGRVSVHGDNSLELEYIATDDGRVHDSVKLWKDDDYLQGCNNNKAMSGLQKQM